MKQSKYERRKRLEFEKRQREQSELAAIECAQLVSQMCPHKRIIAFAAREYQANQFHSSLMNTDNMSEGYLE